MALSAFDDATHEPSDDDLAAMLGRSHASWAALTEHLESTYTPLTVDWNWAGAKWGWSLRLKRKKRTILYLTPCRRHFLVGFALGEKAVRAAHESDLPPSVLETIDAAPRYAEGRGVRLEVRFKKDVRAIEALAAIKMAN